MRLSRRTIEKLAQMICGAHGNEDHPSAFRWPNFPYRTGPKLTEFFYDDCRLPYKHEGTRIIWVIDVLKELNESKASNQNLPTDNIVLIIRELLDSVRYDQPNTHQGAIEDINSILIHDGFLVEYLNGKYEFALVNEAEQVVKVASPQSISLTNTQARLHIDDIDSFVKVKFVSPSAVSEFLSADGYLDIEEDFIQKALEDILQVPFHKKDWGGEINDLYTANVFFNVKRLATAFLLKGHGLRSDVLKISDCGKNGDQIVRLFDSPAQLFIIRFVGNISENLIKDVNGKTNERRLQGNFAHYCMINGQDTARILHAYGKL